MDVVCEENADESIRINGPEEEQYAINKQIVELSRKLALRIVVDNFRCGQARAVTRAFNVWKSVLPMRNKCDELARQLQERILVIGTLRDSYLRDVISIKYHLDVLSRHPQLGKRHEEVTVSENQEKESNTNNTSVSEDMYSLKTIPSASLKALVDIVRGGVEPSSKQLQEALYVAGCLNSDGKAINPWDQSKHYQALLKKKYGINRKDFGGENLPLYAPSSHRLYVRYCSDCVGVMNIIHEWNAKVETSIRYHTQGETHAAQMQIYKHSILNLSTAVAEREEELIKLRHTINEYDGSKIWLSDWEKASTSGTVHMQAMREEVKMVKNQVAMAGEDRRSSMVNTMVLQEGKMARLHRDLAAAKLSAQYEQDVRKEQRQMVCDLNARVQLLEQTLANKDSALEKISAVLENMLVEKNTLQADYDRKVADLKAYIEELLQAIEKRRKETEKIRAKAEDDVETANLEAERMSKDYQRLEGVVESLRNQLARVKELMDQVLQREGRDIEEEGTLALNEVSQLEMDEDSEPFHAIEKPEEFDYDADKNEYRVPEENLFHTGDNTAFPTMDVTDQYNVADLHPTSEPGDIVAVSQLPAIQASVHSTSVLFESSKLSVSSRKEKAASNLSQARVINVSDRDVDVDDVDVIHNSILGVPRPRKSNKEDEKRSHEYRTSNSGEVVVSANHKEEESDCVVSEREKLTPQRSSPPRKNGTTASDNDFPSIISRMNEGDSVVDAPVAPARRDEHSALAHSADDESKKSYDRQIVEGVQEEDNYLHTTSRKKSGSPKQKVKSKDEAATSDNILPQNDSPISSIHKIETVIKIWKAKAAISAPNSPGPRGAMSSILLSTKKSIHKFRVYAIVVKMIVRVRLAIAKKQYDYLLPKGLAIYKQKQKKQRDYELRRLQVLNEALAKEKKTVEIKQEDYISQVAALEAKVNAQKEEIASTRRALDERTEVEKGISEKIETLRVELKQVEAREKMSIIGRNFYATSLQSVLVATLEFKTKLFLLFESLTALSATEPAATYSLNRNMGAARALEKLRSFVTRFIEFRSNAKRSYFLNLFPHSQVAIDSRLVDVTETNSPAEADMSSELVKQYWQTQEVVSGLHSDIAALYRLFFQYHEKYRSIVSQEFDATKKGESAFTTEAREKECISSDAISKVGCEEMRAVASVRGGSILTADIEVMDEVHFELEAGSQTIGDWPIVEKVEMKDAVVDMAEDKPFEFSDSVSEFSVSDQSTPRDFSNVRIRCREHLDKLVQAVQALAYAEAALSSGYGKLARKLVDSVAKSVGRFSSTFAALETWLCSQQQREQTLQLELGSLVANIQQYDERQHSHISHIRSLESEKKELRRKYEDSKRLISALKAAIKDSYKVKSREVASLEEKITSMSRQRLATEVSMLREQSTQLSCCLCAVLPPVETSDTAAAVQITGHVTMGRWGVVRRTAKFVPADEYGKLKMTSSNNTNEDLKIIVARPRDINLPLGNLCNMNPENQYESNIRPSTEVDAQIDSIEENHVPRHESKSSNQSHIGKLAQQKILDNVTRPRPHSAYAYVRVDPRLQTGYQAVASASAAFSDPAARVHPVRMAFSGADSTKTTTRARADPTVTEVSAISTVECPEGFSPAEEEWRRILSQTTVQRPRSSGDYRPTAAAMMESSTRRGRGEGVVRPMSRFSALKNIPLAHESWEQSVGGHKGTKGKELIVAAQLQVGHSEKIW